MLSRDLASAPLSGSLAEETDESSSSSSSSSADSTGVGLAREELSLSSNRDGVSAFRSTRGDTRTSLAPPSELAMPFASTTPSSGEPSSEFFRRGTIFFGRPRARLAGVGASSRSGLPSSRPESLSAAFCVTVSLPPLLRVLIRTLGGRTICDTELTVVVVAGVVVALDGTLKLLLLLLLEVPFFSASVSGSSMIMQSELEPSSFSIRRTLVMLVATGGAAAGTGSVTGGEGVGNAGVGVGVGVVVVDDE